MSNLTIKAPYQTKRGTRVMWATINPILLAGEIGCETDSRKFKFGDGISNWLDLKYANENIHIRDRDPEETIYDIGAVWLNTTSGTIFTLALEDTLKKWRLVLTADMVSSFSVAEAAKLKTARNISITGAATANATFDGQTNVELSLVLANSGVVAGEYTKLTVNNKGIITGAQSLATSDMPEDVINNIASKVSKTPDGTNPLLDENNKLNVIYIPDTILSGLVYGGTVTELGVIHASAHALSLDNLSITTVDTSLFPGYYFIFQGTFSFQGYTYHTGDWVISQGNHTPAWEKIDNTDSVTSVNNKTGAVELNTADIAESNSNLYYTEDRATNNFNSNFNLKNLGSAAYTNSTDYATSSQGTKADTALQAEADPTVPSWAKATSKPSYTASETGAYSKSEVDNLLTEYSKTAEQNVQADWSQSDTTADNYIKNKPTSLPADGGNADTLNNKQASDFATSSQGTKADTALQTETDPTVPSWAKATSKPSYTASETGAYSKSEVDNLLSGFTGGGGSANSLGPVKAGECWTPIFESGILVRCVYFYTGDVDPGTITIPADIHGGAEEYFDYPIPFCIAALSVGVASYADYLINEEAALKVWNNKVLNIYVEIAESPILLESNASEWESIKLNAISTFNPSATANIIPTLSLTPGETSEASSMLEVFTNVKSNMVSLNEITSALPEFIHIRELKTTNIFSYFPDNSSTGTVTESLAGSYVELATLFMVSQLFTSLPEDDYVQLDLPEGIGETTYVTKDITTGLETIRLVWEFTDPIFIIRQSVMMGVFLYLDDGTKNGLTPFKYEWPFVRAEYGNLGQMADLPSYADALERIGGNGFFDTMYNIETDIIASRNYLLVSISSTYACAIVTFRGKNIVPKDANGNYYPLKRATLYYKGV